MLLGNENPPAQHQPVPHGISSQPSLNGRYMYRPLQRDGIVVGRQPQQRNHAFPYAPKVVIGVHALLHERRRQRLRYGIGFVSNQV